MTTRRLLGAPADGLAQSAAIQQGLQRGMAPTSRTRTSGASQVVLRRRSQRYLQALRSLDASGTTRGVDIDDLRRQIDEEFPMPAEAVPQGIIATCYLGPPYEVHTLDALGGIIEHYPPRRTLPAGMEPHRILAMSPHYLAIEVYTDRVVCLKSDGTCVERKS